MSIKNNFELALQYFQRGEFKNAANILELVISGERNNADANHLLGVIEAICENPVRARFLVELSIRMDPNIADAHYHLGNILLMQLGEPEGAIESFSKAISLNPQLLEARLNRAVAFDRLSMYEAALKDYQQILIVDPGLFEVHIRMGKILLKLSKMNDALCKFKAAIECNSNSEEAYHGAAYVLSQQGLFFESRVMYEKALKITPKNDAIMANFGSLDLKLGNFRTGLEKIKCAQGVIEFNLIDGVSIK